MDQILSDFILALRSSGIRISIPESIDAMDTVKLTGYYDREVLKDSLAAVLAKSLFEKEIFEECFENFFSFDAFSEEGEDSSEPMETEISEVDSSLSQMILSGDTGGLAASMREAAQEVNITGIQFFTQKGLYIHRILRHMGIAELRQDMRRLYKEDTPSSRKIALKLEEGLDYLFENVKDFVEKQFSLYSPSVTEKLLEDYLKNVKLSNLEQRDFHRMHNIIQKMVKRLNDIHSRRRKKYKRGQLDFRKTLRNNITYQGLLFDIQWKKKKVDRPDIIAICDVSRSVEAVARFLLLFLYSLNKALARIRTFIFCSNLIEVTHVFNEYPVEEALVKLKSGVGLGIVLGRTDYGQAFRDLKEDWFHLITNKTSVLILGDARNNFGDPETGILKSIQERSKRLVWLNSEPRSFWGVGDSEMKKYLPYCHLARECNTVTHLERVVDSLL
ncbi:MAG: VWA domain-containing protein [Thermodesulfobacteriota bacterium]|nr:VWA domain-containing protein [Thermodesulfobacteriota bacterium]